jgi:GGDEF domain-containing protein
MIKKIVDLALKNGVPVSFLNHILTEKRDPLTGLYTNEHFRERLCKMVETFKPGEEFLVMFVKGAGQTYLQEKYGQPESELLIKTTAEASKGSLNGSGANGQICRIIGSEFGLIVTGSNLEGKATQFELCLKVKQEYLNSWRNAADAAKSAIMSGLAHNCFEYAMISNTATNLEKLADASGRIYREDVQTKLEENIKPLLESQGMDQLMIGEYVKRVVDGVRKIYLPIELCIGFGAVSSSKSPLKEELNSPTTTQNKVAMIYKTLGRQVNKSIENQSFFARYNTN